MATLALALAGSAIGGGVGGTFLGVGAATWGMAAGQLLGSILFAPDGQKLQGPRLSDLNAGSASEGADIPMVWGQARLAGQLVWKAPVTETKHKKKIKSGKGGSSSSQTTYTYSCSFAVDFGRMRRGTGVLRKIIMNGKVYVDFTGTSEVTQIKGLSYYWYSGGQSQPDPLIEAYIGVGNVSARKGRMYLVFDELPLSDEFGNRLPTVQVEVSSSASGDAEGEVITGDVDVSGGDDVLGHNPVYMHYTGSDKVIVSFEDGTGSLQQELNSLDQNTHIFDLSSKKVLVTRKGAAIEGVVSGMGFRKTLDDDYFSSDHQYIFYDLKRLSRLGSFQVSGTGSRMLTGTVETLTEGAFIYYADTNYLYSRAKGYYGGADNIITLPQPPFNRVPRAGYINSNKPFLFFPSMGLITDPSVVYGVFSVTPMGVQQTLTLPAGLVPANVGRSVPDQPAVSDTDGEQIAWIPMNDHTGGSVIPKLVGIDIEGRLQGIYSLAEALPHLSNTSWGASSLPSTFYDPATELVTMTYGGRHVSFNPRSRSFSAETWFSSNSSWAIYHAETNTYWANSVDPLDRPGLFFATRGALGQPAPVPVAQIIEDLCNDAGIESEWLDIAVDDTVHGYAHTQQTSVRSDLEPLMVYCSAYAVSSDWLLKFKSLGAAPAAEISYEQTGLEDNGFDSKSPIVRVEPELVDLPRTVTLDYISVDNGLQPASARADWFSTESRRTAATRLPVVMNDADAAQLAQRILQLSHEATTYQFTLPRDYQHLEPGDVIMIEDITGTQQRVRLTSMTRGANDLIECEAASDNPAHLETYAVTAGSGYIIDQITGNNDVDLVILDTPLLRDADADHPGPYMAVYNSLGFLGGTLYASADDEAFESVTEVGLRAGVGSVITPPGDADFEAWDDTNTIQVQWFVDGELSSTTDANLLNGANAVAIGAPGRWEILNVGTVTQVSPGVDALSHLLRGRRGTNVHTGSHQQYDLLVVLDSETIYREVLEMAQAGSTRYYRVPLAGDSVADAETTVHNIGYEPLQPYTPIDPVSVEDPVTNNIAVSVTPRSRRMGVLGGANLLTDGVGAVDSNITGYRFQLVDESGNELAYFDSATPSYTFTASQILAAYGENLPLVRWRASAISALVPTVSRYCAASEIQSGAEIFYNDIVSARANLIEFWPLNDASGTLAASWSGTHNGTHTGAQYAAQPSITTDGEPSVSYPNTGNATNFTEWAGLADIRAIEFVIKWDGARTPLTQHSVLGLYTSIGSSTYTVVKSTGDNRIIFEAVGTGGTTTVTAATPLSNDTPYHVVVNFGITQGDPVEIYVDGVLDGSGSVAHTFAVPTVFLQFNAGGPFRLEGWMSKVAFYNTPLTPAEVAESAGAA